MAPMGIRLSPLGVAVFCLLGLGVLYHLYSGFLAGRFASFLLGGPHALAGGIGSDGLVDLRELLAASVAAAVRGGAEINSEEHVDENNPEIIAWDHIIPDDIARQVQPKLVPAESITMWIDPLDATQEYTENLSQYVTTMVCAAVDGKPIVGVIHKPFSGYTAWAMVNGGSNIQPRSSYNERTPTIIVSRSHEGQVKQMAWQSFGNQTAIIKAGGAGYKVLSLLNVPEVNQEKADVYIHVTFIKKWDICAGNAMLKALGGRMTTLAGEDITYTGSDGNEDGLIASIKMNHQALVEKLPVLAKTSRN
uniref:Golgi-resident adenosine 3',5'-bisphosphate 3'-phosphatase n=1 Tax=Laticauda laticaudata TaxID=8630 RepID=A0A8C5SCB0_LATLA